MWKHTYIQILFIAVATTLSGELRIAPFGWEFRFGLGPSLFLLLLLFLNHLPLIRTGMITGVVVVLFRTLTSTAFMLQPASFFDVVVTHLPAMFYYWVFALGLSRINKALFKSNLLYLGVLVIMIDVGSNIVEIWVRKLLIETTPLLWTEWLALLLIASIRVYFIIGLYANIILKQLRAIHEEQQKRFEQMLSISSSLYGESFYLKKMMDTIEQVTIRSFKLYRRLKEDDLPNYSKEALRIAEKIHEVKKDSQRIMAGLSRLYDQQTVVEMSLADISQFVSKANQQYSEWLGKKIHLETELTTNYITPQHLPLLTLLNNLVANSVEAIEEEGRIELRIAEENEHTYFTVQDNGKGIPEKDLSFIFEPGYTTKYDATGTASTGIGLSHVKNIVDLLSGETLIIPLKQGGTKFIIKLPTAKLRTGS